MNRSPLQVVLLAVAVGVCLVAGGHPSASAQVVAEGPRQWQVLVDNVSPEGHTWSFNAFYPSLLQVHAGDTITLRVAPNPNAFHQPTFLHAGFTPQQAYSGFMFEDPYVEGGLLATFFHNTANFTVPPRPPCGREGQAPCTFDASRPFNTAMLISPPPGSGGVGNPSFTFTVAPTVNPGSYYFLCSVHGPGMSGRLDVLPAAEPVQSAAALAADARRAYEADLLQLTGEARAITTPTFAVNPTDGRKTWRIALGGGRETRLAVNEVGVRTLTINSGETVVWGVAGPPGVFHALSGFATQPDQAVPPQQVIVPACESSADPASIPAVAPPRLQGRQPPPFRNSVRTVATSEDEFPFDPDLWNTCPGEELVLVTDKSVAEPPSGTDYSGGPVRSGILMHQAYLEGLFGAGLPFLSSYSLRLMEAGTYHYVCVVHHGMEGWITVRPPPAPAEPGLP